MAKTKISEYDATAANNTDIDGVNIAESCPPSGINNAIREVMAHLKDFQSGTSGDDLTIAGTLDVTGNFTVDNSSGTSGQVLLSAGSGSTPTWGDAFVSGMIMMWSGSIATIPSGWVLCDGTNSTPDLRNRFVVGAGDTYSVDGTGGSADAIVVSHTHTGTTNGGGSHTHTLDGEAIYGQAVDGTGTPSSGFTGGYPLGQINGINSVGNHTHSFTTNSTGSSGTNKNLPPYYALAYIMKT